MLVAVEGVEVLEARVVEFHRGGGLGLRVFLGEEGRDGAVEEGGGEVKEGVGRRREGRRRGGMAAGVVEASEDVFRGEIAQVKAAYLSSYFWLRLPNFCLPDVEDNGAGSFWRLGEDRV